MPTLKTRAPQQLKVVGRRVSLAAGIRSASRRMTPAFVLAGGQRCGTTSLFRALLEHPAILGPVHHKGINYFDINYESGWDWYQGHFPLRSRAARASRRAGEEAITFDASGYYMFHPHAPERLGRDLPGVKVLVMLRDPVERAYSAHKHELARGFETEPFARALELEDERVEPELARMLADPTYNSFSHRHHSYRRRGFYVEQIERLRAAVGADRVHVVESEVFFAEPANEFGKVIEFLGLRPHQPDSFAQWNARPGAPMPEEARALLGKAFEPYDAALETLLGRPPGWRR